MGGKSQGQQDSCLPVFEPVKVLCSPEDRSLPTRRSYRPTKIQLGKWKEPKNCTHSELNFTMAEHMHCLITSLTRPGSEILFHAWLMKKGFPLWLTLKYVLLLEALSALDSMRALQICIIRNFSGNILQNFVLWKRLSSLYCYYICVCDTHTQTYIHI